MGGGGEEEEEEGDTMGHLIALGSFSIRRDNACKNGGNIFCYAIYTCFLA